MIYWLKKLFRSSYIAKNGFIKSEGDSELRTATFYIYRTGVCAVERNCTFYEATERCKNYYTINGTNSMKFTEFVATEE